MTPLFRSLLAVSLLFPMTTSAQDYRDSTATEKEKVPDTPRPWKDRIWFGGGLGLSFGSVTNIAIEPMVGYKITKNGKLSVGVGISYQYFRDNRYTPAFETSVYGGRLFTRYRIIEQLFAHAEYNQLSFGVFYVSRNRFDRRLDALSTAEVAVIRRGLGGNTYLTATWCSSM